MATKSKKTVRLDELAYQRLEGLRRAGESISEAIVRCVPQRRSLAEVEVLIQQDLSMESIENMDASLTRRRRTQRSPRS